METPEGGGGGFPRGGGGGTEELAGGNDGVALGADTVAVFFMTGCRESSKLPDTGTRWPLAYMHWT